MANEEFMDIAIIKKTQELLGKYVKKPPLTEKLLRKPPFRFLQDIVGSIIKETGYLHGLYSKSDLSAEGITDRNAKITFLQKLIDVLKIVSNENITARPSKIVAGHEPIKTNEMLQILGTCLDKKLDFTTAIEKVTIGDKMNEQSKSTDSKEVKNKKANESKIGNNNKQVPKERTESKLQNIPKDNIKEKEKLKSTPIKKEKDKLKNKEKNREKTKQKQENKSSSSKFSVDKQDLKLLQKTQESEIKNSPVESPLTGKNGNEVSEKYPLNKVSDQVIHLSPGHQKAIEKHVSKENTLKATTTNTSTESNLSANKQKLESEAILNELLPSNEHNDFHESDKVKMDLILNDKNESSPNNVKLKENRKSSGTQRKQFSNKNDFISAFNEATLTKQINTSSEQQGLVPQKVSEKNDSTQKNKNSKSQYELVTVTRQSTFTREESKDSNGRPRTSLRPPSVRPPSARPGAPRRRDKNIEIVLQPNDQIKMAGIQLKVESFNNELDDDGENLVIIENENNNDIHEDTKKPVVIIDEMKVDDNGQQGHLVQQILETQKELTQNYDLKEIKDEDLDVTTIQNRQSSAKQMNSLRDVIQNLTRSINPLGKLMDFIPEDMDAMQLEMNLWRDMYSQTSAELKKEKSLTESAIEPMKGQLEQINGNIKEYIEMIDECRAKILQNSETIYRLLTDY